MKTTNSLTWGSRLRQTIRNARAAIDLASIMVGTLVIGTIAGVIAVAVFAVIPWSQDSAARSSISVVPEVQAASMVRDGAFGSSRELDENGWLQTSARLATAAGDDSAKCWVAVAKSETGKVFYLTNASADVRDLHRTTAVGCIDKATLDKLVESIGGYDGVALVNLRPVTFADGTVGKSYSGQIDFDSEVAVRFTVSDGTLPAGLDLDPDTGKITGTPTANKISPFTITAENSAGKSTRLYSITVGIAAPVILTAALPGAVVGTQYSATIEYSGESTTLSYGLGNLPDGLTFDPTTAVIAGIPTVAGTSTFTVSAMNTGGISSQALSITTKIAAPKITTTALPDGSKGSAYTATVAGTGDAVTYSISAGKLPAGLSISSSTGVISGTPTAAETETFTVRARNDGGDATQQLSIKVEVGAPVITRASLPAGVKGATYSQTVTWTGENVLLSKSLGTLPDGLTLNGSTGVISGSPTVAGTFGFTISAMNGGGTSAQSYSVTITHAAPTITTTALAPGVVNSAWAQTLTGSGEAVTYSISAGSLPAGITLNATTGVLSGTPTTAGVASFTVSKTNTGGTASKALTVDVKHAAPTISTASLGGGIVGSAYSQTIAGTGSASTHSFTGTLPPGISLSTAGVLSGTPSTAGTFSFTVTKTNNGGSASKALSITIASGDTTVTMTQLQVFTAAQNDWEGQWGGGSWPAAGASAPAAGSLLAKVKSYSGVAYDWNRGSGYMMQVGAAKPSASNLAAAKTATAGWSAVTFPGGTAGYYKVVAGYGVAQVFTAGGYWLVISDNVEAQYGADSMSLVSKIKTNFP